MKVILLSDVKKVGKKGQVLEVSDGYGANYLIPNKLAVKATKTSMDIKQKQDDDEALRQENLKQDAIKLKDELEKLTLEEIKVSNRRYPFIDFKYDREIGNDILFVEGLTKEGYFKDLSFTVKKNEKIAFLCSNTLVLTMLFDILTGKEKADSGSIKWGKTITYSYLMNNSDEYFDNCNLTLIDWLRRFSKDQTETFLRGWLGRMLFTREEATKKASVLSGGEKVRCMLAKEMLRNANVLIMNDPSNHLDLETITSLNKGMINFKGNILFYSHDHEINSTVANRIIVIEDGTKVFDKTCTYDEYLEIRRK